MLFTFLKNQVHKKNCHICEGVAQNSTLLDNSYKSLQTITNQKEFFSFFVLIRAQKLNANLHTTAYYLPNARNSKKS